MYRIELSAGEETAFRTIEELAVAIRRNVVTSKARIWHNASNKWLPIQFHPHYKLAVAMPLTQADLVAGPPVTPLSVLKLGEPVTPAVPSSREAATQAALTAWPAPKPTQAPTAKPAPAPTAKPIPSESPPRPRGSNHARDAGSRAPARTTAPICTRAPTRCSAGPCRGAPEGRASSSRRAGTVEPDQDKGLAENEEIRSLAASRAGWRSDRRLRPVDDIGRLRPQF